jgi:hypothetical protein
MLQSIRKRGFESTNVILQPAPESITKSWLPSENIACWIKTSPPSPSIGQSDYVGPKYVLVEISNWETINKTKAEFSDIPPGSRLALFGAAPAPPTMRFADPYIDSPLNLDELVERIDSRDWGLPVTP